MNAIVVYYDHSPRFTLGPFGCFEIGHAIEIPDGRGEAIICAIDGDGAGVAYLTDWLKAKAEQNGTSLEAEIEDRRAARTTHLRITEETPQRVIDAMRARADRYREEFGVLSSERVPA